jgi:hypothetical protein
MRYKDDWKRGPYAGGNQMLIVPRRRALWTFANTSTALWLDGGDPSTVTAPDGLTSEWNDKKGNGINVVATGSARPTYTQAGLNNRNIVTFNGTSNVMRSVGANLLRGVSGATIIAVVRRQANNPVEANILGITTSTNATRANVGYRSPAAGNEGIFAGGRRLAANTFQATGASPYTSSFVIVRTVFNYSAATLDLYENGTLTSSRAFQASGVTDNDGGAISIGANAPGTGGFLNGDIAELAIIHSAITAAFGQRCDGYLAHRWELAPSLDASHPFKAFPPYQ